MEEKNELPPFSEAPRAPAPDPGEGLSTPALGSDTYIGPTSSMCSVMTLSEHDCLQADQQRTCLRMRQAAVMLRACCECCDCASAGADIAPDATVRALTGKNNQ